MSRSSRVRVDAPAKINLGLELLGKRPDGYHEIRTVMAMVGLYDHVVVSATGEDHATPPQSIDLGGGNGT
ncbi:MAG: hypothetical protein QM753_06710 [Thermomicrobiales bacterium]